MGADVAIEVTGATVASTEAVVGAVEGMEAIAELNRQISTCEGAESLCLKRSSSHLATDASGMVVSAAFLGRAEALLKKRSIARATSRVK